MSTRSAVAIAICIGVLVTAAAGQPGRGGVSHLEVAAGVPDEFKALYGGGIPVDRVPQVWAGLPYDRIELERTACFGTCPVDRVTLFRGGRAELRGIEHTERIGDFDGKVSIFDYGKLCYLLKRFGFDELAPRYTAGWTDAPTFIVKATSGGNTKTVSDYAGVGPVELWAMQQAIDAVAQRIRWGPK